MDREGESSDQDIGTGIVNGESRSRFIPLASGSLGAEGWEVNC